MTSPFRLDGRTALITGGASGIGEATARVFVSAGASVLIADVDRTRAEARRNCRGPRRWWSISVDEAAVRQAIAGLARLDVLVNHAGIGLVGGIEETQPEDFERLFR